MKPLYLCGQIKVIGVICTPNIWWYLLILAQRYGAETEFPVLKVGDTIIIRVMSTFKAIVFTTKSWKSYFLKETLQTKQSDGRWAGQDNIKVY